MSFTMYDSVDVNTVPDNPRAVAGYTGGAWPTYNALVKKFPNAHHLSIAPFASEDADCLDVEPGDATTAQAPAWCKRQISLGKWRPVLYTSLSNVRALIDAMRAAGIDRSQYRIWGAHYTGVPHIEVGCDATQYDDRALGRNLDASLCSDDFFGAAKPSTWQPADEVNWCREWDRIAGKKPLRYHLRRLFLRAKMLQRRHQITLAAKKNGWDKLNRVYRYKQLQLRSRAHG